MAQARHHDAGSRFFTKSLRKKQLFRDVTRCLIKQCEISLCALQEQDGRSSAVATAGESQLDLLSASSDRGLRHRHNVLHKRKHRTGFLIDFMLPSRLTNDRRQH
jgi:hypothetical protein